jgi:hypothetical protein
MYISKKICAFEFCTFFRFLSIFKKRLYGILTRFFAFLGRIKQLDKDFRLRLNCKMRINENKFFTLYSPFNLSQSMSLVFYDTVYVVLSSQNDVGILFFSIYLKSKILHCFHFYFDIIQIKYTSFLTLFMSRFMRM